MSSSITLHLSLSLGLTDWATLADEPASGMLLSLSPQSRGDKCELLSPASLHMFRGSHSSPHAAGTFLMEPAP